MWLWWLGILCDGHPFTSDPGIILVTSPEFPRKIAQQKRHCRAKPTHNTQGIVWPTSKAWQGILRSCRHFIWQLAGLRDVETGNSPSFVQCNCMLCLQPLGTSLRASASGVQWFVGVSRDDR